MYDTIPINFNVLCDKTTQIESVKKKTANQDDKFKKRPKRIQSFSEQHKTFPYDRNKSRNQDRFQNKSEKSDDKGGQKKKYRAQRRSTGSPAMGLNTVKNGRQQGVFKKKIKCYNCQKLKHYANNCFESDHKQQKNIKKQ